MQPATRRSSIDDHDHRARNGGTSTPAGSSVWDIEPAPVDGGGGLDAEATTTAGQATQPPITTHSSVQRANTSPSTRRSGTVVGAVPRLEPDRTVPMPVGEADMPVGDHTAPNTLLGVDRRLVLILLVVSTLALATWFFLGSGSVEDSTATEGGAERSDAATLGDAVDVAAAPLPTTLPSATADATIIDPDQVIAAPPLAMVDAESASESAVGDEPAPRSIDEVVEPDAPVMEPDVRGNDEPEVPRPIEPAPVLLPATDPEVEPETEPVVEDDGVVDATDTAASADVRRVEIVKKIEPCRFGRACLVAGFELAGFDPLPDEFVCEFGSGARYTFELPATRVAVACVTGSRDSSITIEVDGVRSDPIVFD